MPYPDSISNWPPPPQPDLFKLPETFSAGDTFELRIRSSNYPPIDGWMMVLAGRGGSTAIDIASITNEGGDFVLTQTADNTASWAPGNYLITVYAIKDTERHRIFEGLMEITRDMPEVSAPVDLRTPARRILDNYMAVAEGRASNDILDSQIDNTMFRRMTPYQIHEGINFWTARVRMEEAKMKVKAGQGSGRNVFARFTRPL